MTEATNVAHQLAVLGECMVEVKPTKSSGQFDAGPIAAHIGYGGDTLNCSVYLARLSVGVSYVTSVGDDPLSDWMVDQWQAEGINCDQVRRANSAVPGLYLIDTDEHGERSFYYGRDQAPFRSLFDDPQQS
ncbi:MAG: PfkB family carbohydrate kinase, partial [Pseudomonadota bacterium]